MARLAENRLRSAALATTLSIVFCLVAGSGAAQAAVVTFLPTGGEQTFVVPPGVTSIQMTAIGGRGGNGSSAGGVGGFGAIASADVAVTPGQVLYVEVGGNGAGGASGGAGGFNGGGAGGDDISYDGGGAGGASDVRQASRVAGTSIASRLIVAGGGGGGGGGSFGPGSNNSGGHGGSPATGGNNNGAEGAGPPGTATKGGKGQCAEGDGVTATGGLGGTYARCGYPSYGGGGGGGGGLFGGAGGAASSAGNGGGAGSSGFGPGATNSSVGTDDTGSPSIAFSFTPGPTVPPVETTPVTQPAPPSPSPSPAAAAKCTVPKLGGRKLRGARKSLGNANCALGKVRRRKPDAEHVVAQTPKPGETRPAGSKVSVTLGA